MEAIGGPKAGAHQALGLFAFLFDRDIRGMEKDEAIELIWPESPLPVADMAFHRTMLGLRRSLGGSTPDIIEFRAGRYFLSETLIASSDLADLEDLLDASGRENEPGARIALLERCRSLNRPLTGTVRVRSAVRYPYSAPTSITTRSPPAVCRRLRS